MMLASAVLSCMFEKWLMMKPDASWSQLVTALTTVGLNSLAVNVKIQLQTGTGHVIVK